MLEIVRIWGYDCRRLYPNRANNNVNRNRKTTKVVKSVYQPDGDHNYEPLPTGTCGVKGSYTCSTCHDGSQNRIGFCGVRTVRGQTCFDAFHA